MTDILMPALSDSMESGTVLSWLKAEGELVGVGDELLEIETDKSTVTHVAEAAGVLEIVAPEGATVAVGDAIGRVLEAAESAGFRPGDAPTPPPETGPAADVSVHAASAPDQSALANVGADNGSRGTVRPVATPVARRVAAVHGVALEHVTGTGPLGRISRADVLRAAGVAIEPAPLPGIDRSESPLAKPLGARRQPSRLQQLIARRMTEAKATIPHFQVQTEVAMGATVAAREQFKSLAGEGDLVPSFNDFIIKASALALRDHPLANGSFVGGLFELHDEINVGVAVAAQDALVVPTIFGPDGKSLGEIARESRRLAERVRSGEIGPAELSGGTFTVSNLGMFGMTAITPVINPPQAAILGVGAIRDVLARVDGEIVDRALLTLTLSCDHRILYGADAARFLARIRQLLEAPIGMAL